MLDILNHSINTTLLIYSTFTDFRSKRDNELLFHCHAGFNPKQKKVKGCYRGKEELSLLKIQEYDGEAQDLAINFEQESVLKLVDHRRGLYKAYLVFKGGNEDFIGYFRSVSSEVALKQEAWSLIDGVYYIVTPEDETIVDTLVKLGYHK